MLAGRYVLLGLAWHGNSSTVILYNVQCKIFLDLGWHCLHEFTTKCILQEFIAYLCLYLTVTIRDNDLLLQLLEEFPHLHISPRTLNKMWQRQLAHTLHLKALSGRPRPKLHNEVSVLILTCWVSAEIPWHHISSTDRAPAHPQHSMEGCSGSLAK